jgi:hypothetical protein
MLGGLRSNCRVDLRRNQDVPIPVNEFDSFQLSERGAARERRPTDSRLWEPQSAN